MNDYSKWDNIADSDEEQEKRQQKYRSYEDEQAETRRQLQSEVDNWLRRQIQKLPRDGQGGHRARNHSHSMPTQDYGSNFGGAGMNWEDRHRSPGGMPESKENTTPMRNVTKAEREVMAMLIAMSHFEEGDTNLDRHAMILDLVRQNRWLEEDPGSLELLCRVHNHVMKGGEDSSRGRYQGKDYEDPEQFRMRNMCLSGINTLAAPKRTKCVGGLLELFTQICTPETEPHRELRRKWQTKDFAKDALFDSLFPDLKQYSDGEEDDGFGSDFWIMVVLGVLAIVGIIAIIVLYSSGAMPAMGPHPKKGASRNISTIENTTLAGAASHGATASSLAPPSPPSTLAPAPAPLVGKLSCTDSDEGCAAWSQMGECTNNAEFMLANCKLSCGVCKVSAPAPGRAPAAPLSGASAAGEL